MDRTIHDSEDERKQCFEELQVIFGSLDQYAQALNNVGYDKGFTRSSVTYFVHVPNMQFVSRKTGKPELALKLPENYYGHVVEFHRRHKKKHDLADPNFPKERLS
ncbi:hypothetical protein DFQ28_011704, partial [Apophysomyces sp. BC1034]